jgi:succinate-acetate transporter protein
MNKIIGIFLWILSLSIMVYFALDIVNYDKPISIGMVVGVVIIYFGCIGLIYETYCEMCKVKKKDKSDVAR